MDTVTIHKNWEAGTTPSTLKNIHKKNVNISIYDRDIQHLTREIDDLLHQKIEVRSSGEIDSIINEVAEATESELTSPILQDIKELLLLFKEVSGATSFRLLLATVTSNMCRRFHTDVNDLRMLCTYKGQGTLWLPEDNINRRALDTNGDNETIVIDESRVQQAKTGSVLILKGAIYPHEETRAIVHRSPTIEEYSEQRLLLRIDTNEFLNF